MTGLRFFRATLFAVNYLSAAIFSAAFLLSACATHSVPPIPSVNPEIPDEGQSEWRVPCAMHSGLCYVSARVNDSKELQMVVDTGSSISVLNTPVSQQLKLTPFSSGQTAAPGAGAESSYTLFNDLKIRLDDLELLKQEMIGLPFAYVKHRTHHRTDGTIGASVLKNFVVEINFERSDVIFFKPGAWSIDPNYESLPLEFVGDVPVVLASVNGIAGRFIIDTGQMLSGLLITPQFRQSAKLGDIKTQMQPPVEVTGGKMKYSQGTIQSLRFGKTEIKSLTTSFAEEPRGIYADSTIAGGIGPKALEHFDLIIDYPNKKLYFKRW